MKKKLLIVDSHGLIHRAFHALPPLTTPEGKPIGAVYGLATMLVKLLATHKPDYAVAAFDRPEPTFRKERLAAYKAQRPPVDPNLVTQFESARELTRALNLPILDRAGYEADDIIASLVERFGNDVDIVIASGDLDTLQLVRGTSVTVETPRKGLGEIVTYDPAAVKDRFGIPPELIPDYKGLVGDTSDNIPGVPGIGPKGASELLQAFGSLERAIEGADRTRGVGKKLAEGRESAVLSKELATMDHTVPIEGNLESFRYESPNPEELAKTLEGFGFVSLIKRLGLREVGEEVVTPKETGAIIVTPGGKSIEWSWKEIIRAELPKEVPRDIEDLSLMAWLVNPEENQNLSFGEACAKFKIPNPNPEAQRTELWEKLSKEIGDRDLSRVYRNIELPLVPVLARMEWVGIAVNAKKLSDLEKSIEGELAIIEKEISAVSHGNTNLNSPQQVGELIFEKLGVTPRGRKTATGKIRTDRKALEELRGEHPLIGRLIEHREHAKVKSGFVTPIRELAEAGGEVHTTFIQNGTATGRLASKQPNIQNIPQESPWSLPLRRAFESRDGRSFLSFDYSQLELRLLAHVSGDKNLLAAFASERDIHTETAVRVFGVNADSVSKSMRRTAKVLNFGVAYGMGPRSFAETSGLELAEAKRIVAGYFENFPGVRVWQEKTVREVQANGFVMNENGRKRYFGTERFPGEFDREAINMPIQSLEADILKVAMVEVAKIAKKRGAELILSIHDELLFEVPDGMLREIEPLLKSVMESAVNIKTPLIVEAKSGKTWGDMEPVGR